MYQKLSFYLFFRRSQELHSLFKALYYTLDTSIVLAEFFKQKNNLRKNLATFFVHYVEF